MTRRRHFTLGEIFAAPLLVASVTIIGLVAALLGDGWFDMFSWIGLSVPVLVISWALVWRRC